ncbi:NAD+ synthase [Candidatus Saganbacteria bacterium]|nr:NAD+ synthase [Candidatus Saganbacteria bacterium]
MKLALAQINPTVGDLPGNTRKIMDFISRAREQEADLVVFPELAITGYPPEDLLLKPQFISDNLASLKEIVKFSKGIAVYLGFVDRDRKGIYNAGAFIENGRLKKIYHKINLPNYAVFDEKRYFLPGETPAVINKIGLGICEDIWVKGGPYLAEVKLGAKLILNINASPYHEGKIKDRQKLLSKRARESRTPLVYVNMVGGQDELVFDGGSMMFNGQGRLLAAARQYEEELLLCHLGQAPIKAEWLEGEAEVYEALKLGVKDYVNKNGFRDVYIGVSGGIDSALTLAIAADALGKGRVHAVFMPSKFSSELSRKDARQVAKNLGVEFSEIPIDKIFEEYLANLAPSFGGREPNIAEENLQARIRGNTLMALSNKFGRLVLTTGNKSETSTGYCTLYGDMAGGFNVLKDVPKLLVYRLANWRNAEKAVIPESTITRPPTAELKADQTDQDTLPPYEALDPIMQAYVEENLGVKEIAARGFDEETVKKIVSLIDRSEYKRRQAPPGPRISPRAFGKDWRVPITNGYR